MKTLVISMLLCVSGLLHAQVKSSLLNFGHLEHLTERIECSGQSMSIVHVYSNYPDYRWVGAAESGPEGIACVDDAARAAVLYLRHYQRAGDDSSLTRAESLLRFVLSMQTDDGDFYNFIFDDHSINRSGRTSFKSFGWWAARGIWSMGLGSRVLAAADPAFAATLREAVRRSLPHLDSLSARYGQLKSVSGYRVPEWLLYGSGADVTSELLLGLISYYEVAPDSSLRATIICLAQGLMLMQDGSAGRFPYGAHRSWETMCHLWGNRETEALATAGALLKDSAMIASAELEARGFYTRLLIDGYFKEMDVAQPGKKTEFNQIAYGVSPVATGLVRLYDATGKTEYLQMAGLAASWLLGNNVTGQAMYDAGTGRCLDGIRDSLTLNRNSGAESTIEALLTILEVERSPVSALFLRFRKVRSGSHGDKLFALYRNDAGQYAVLVLDVKSSAVRVLEGNDCKKFREEVNE